MYENVKKTDDRVKVKDTYPLKHPEGLHRQRIITDDIRVCARPVPVMQLQPAQNQAVIQMAPYEDLMNNLQDRADMQDLIALIRKYIERKNKYEKNRGKADANRVKTLAEILSEAFDISYVANVINANLEGNEENKVLKETLRVLGKFVHVELSSDETMSLDDLSGILDEVRDIQKDMRGQKIREIGLLAVNDNQEKKQSPHFVLMINGGESADGSGGSVTAPGETTPVFSENWKDVRFIAHTHPNERRLQTNVEFSSDVTASKQEEERNGGLRRAEMVRRDTLTGGKGGTIFYTGGRVLSEKSDERYIDRFTIRADNLESILHENIEHFGSQLAEEQSAQYEQFVNEFIGGIREKIAERDQIAGILQGEALSATGFLELEVHLGELSRKYPEVFDVNELRQSFSDAYWRRFPKSEESEDDDSADLFPDISGMQF